MKQTVLITGTNRGLGFSLVEQFLKFGYVVFAGCRNVGPKLTELSKSWADLKIIKQDVTDEQSVAHSFEAVSRETDHLDVLINNAAIYLTKAHILLADTDFKDIRKMYETNTLGPLRVTQVFLPLLEKGRKKLIINISSEAGGISDCWRTSEYGYTMSKAALNMQSKVLQNFLRPRNIKVLALHPGWMRTDMGGPDADISPEQSAEGIIKLVNKDWTPDDGIYFDFQGVPLAW